MPQAWPKEKKKTGQGYKGREGEAPAGPATLTKSAKKRKPASCEDPLSE